MNNLVFALKLRITANLLIAILFISNILPAQEIVPEPTVEQDELRSVEPVEFTNYIGPYDRVDSLEDIIDIGTQLGALNETANSNYGGKYAIQRILGEGELFNADLLSLSPDAAVDHIRNLRHIISGYLQSQYNYDSDDAYTIATFATYYNAYYRQNAEYFQQKYNPEVNDNLITETIGLSTNYIDWPGGTQIIIPLSAIAILEQEPSPDLDEIGQEAVIEYLDTQEEDKQVAQEIRQDMLDLQQEKLADTQEAVIEKRGELQQENREAQADLKKAELIEAATDALDVRENAQEEQEQLTERLQEIQDEQNQLDAVEQVLAQKQEGINKEQLELDLTQPPPVNLLNRALPRGTLVVLLPVRNKFHQFYGTDGDTLEIIKYSNVDSITSPRFAETDDRYFVVAQGHTIGDTTDKAEANGQVRLLKLHKNFDDDIQGNNDIHPSSGVWEYNGKLFAFLKSGTLARFNFDLQLEDQSSQILQPDFEIQFAEDYLLALSQDKQFIWIDTAALQQRGVLTPIQGPSQN